MNEIKRLFDEDVREKKRIASNASRKAGRSMKNMFPYEKMTGKERKKYMAASEVKTFTLRPMSLVEFNKQTSDQQVELLKWYGEKYGWHAGALRDALDCSWHGAASAIKKNGLEEYFENNLKRMSEAEIRRQRANRKDLKRMGTQAAHADPTLTTGDVKITFSEALRTQKEPPKQDDGVIYQIVLRGGRKGQCLRDQLIAIADTLVLNEAYVVELSIKQFASAPKAEDSVSDVENT